MDGVIVTLLAVIVAMMIYFLSLHRDLQSIKNTHESALREVKEARRDFADIRKEFSSLVTELAHTQKHHADRIEAEIKRCEEVIDKTNRRIAFLEELSPEHRGIVEAAESIAKRLKR